MSEVVIKADNISKLYKLYQKPTDRMKEALHPLRKSYHSDFYALKDVSFEIRKGETVGIIGANGAGKSTLLKIITGVMGPTTGRVSVQGRISSLLELGAGFNPDMNGYENIYFMGTILGFSRTEISEKVDEIVKFVDIGEYINQPVRSYSSGMMARLGFGVAVHVEPDVLIIDEALSVGDIRFQQKAIRKMKDMMEKAKAILFVSHSMDTVRTMCGRCIWIDKGHVFQDGVSKEVTKNFYAYMATGSLPDKASKSEGKDTADKQTNKLEIIDVSNLESIGEGGCKVTGISLYETKSKSSLNILSGGEYLTFLIKLHVVEEINDPQVAINIVNKLGQNIFGVSSNWFEEYYEPLEKGHDYDVSISFKLPMLMNGEYSMNISIANLMGNGNKIIHCRIFDCMIINVASTDIKQRHDSLIIPDSAEIKFEMK